MVWLHVYHTFYHSRSTFYVAGLCWDMFTFIVWHNSHSTLRYSLCFCILHEETWLMFVFPDENPAWGNISQVANYLKQPACLCRGREPVLYWEVSKIWIWCSAFNFLLYPRAIILLFLLSFPLSFEFIIFKICICWDKTNESYKEFSILFLLRFLQRGGLSWPDRYKQIVLKNQCLLLWLVAPELLPCPSLYFSLVSNWMSQPHWTQRWLNLLSDDLES